MPVKKRSRDPDLANDIDDYESDAGFVVSEDDKPRSKKPKATKPSAATKSSSNTANANEPFWELSKGRNTRRVGISDFKGTRLINIREYYESPAGDLLPGKKGISLSLDQYKAFLKAIPKVNEALNAMGETIESTVVSEDEEDEAPKKASKSKAVANAKTKAKKANIDATSDEEEEE